MGYLINLNGKYVQKEKAVISVFDHGLLYGDGVFEGIRSYNGRVFKLEEHVDRLFASAKAITMTIPISRDKMKAEIVATVKKNKLRDAYIRVVVTRGVGDLGLNPTKCPKAFYFIIAASISLYPEKYYKEGLPVVCASTRRNIPEALSPMIKSLNYLNNILAKLEANSANVLEAIMLNREGFVAECTGDNIFIVRNGELITPPTYIGALEGITRDAVIKLGRELGYKVSEKPFTMVDMYIADEAFLTGTAAEIIPVINVDKRNIANGKPGPITKKLIEAYREITRNQGTEVYPK
ncbi:MAG: branched-chain-amino-acid transaminase [Candidatus Firestonebacteria bacterium]